MKDRSLFYEALSRMMGSSRIKVAATDNGLVLTQKKKRVNPPKAGGQPCLTLPGMGAGKPA
eukprot:567456-Rhodomonas_salina.1